MEKCKTDGCLGKARKYGRCEDCIEEFTCVDTFETTEREDENDGE